MTNPESTRSTSGLAGSSFPFMPGSLPADGRGAAIKTAEPNTSGLWLSELFREMLRQPGQGDGGTQGMAPLPNTSTAPAHRPR